MVKNAKRPNDDGLIEPFDVFVARRRGIKAAVEGAQARVKVGVNARLLEVSWELIEEDGGNIWNDEVPFDMDAFAASLAADEEAADFVRASLMGDEPNIGLMEENEKLSAIESMEWYVLEDDLYVKISQGTLWMIWIRPFQWAQFSPRSKEYIFSLSELREISKNVNNKWAFFRSVKVQFPDSGDSTFYSQTERIFWWNNQTYISIQDFLDSSQLSTRKSY